MLLILLLVSNSIALNDIPKLSSVVFTANFSPASNIILTVAVFTEAVTRASFVDSL